MDREQFVRLGILTEVALLAVALVVDILWPLPIEQNPLRTATGLSNFGAVIAGVVAGCVLSGWFFFSWFSELSAFKRIQNFVRDQLAPMLNDCRAWELIVVAAFAGIGEEVLFRGVIQPRVGWLAATLLFGLAHPITPTYVIMAAILGGLLGQLQIVGGNLWAPIIGHAVYDYIGFCLVIRDYRAENRGPPKSDS